MEIGPFASIIILKLYSSKFSTAWTLIQSLCDNSLVHCGHMVGTLWLYMEVSKSIFLSNPMLSSGILY